MSTRSIGERPSLILPSNCKLPEPKHIAIRLLVALASFEEDIGPETGVIATKQAFQLTESKKNQV